MVFSSLPASKLDRRVFFYVIAFLDAPDVTFLPWRGTRRFFYPFPLPVLQFFFQKVGESTPILRRPVRSGGAGFPAH